MNKEDIVNVVALVAACTVCFLAGRSTATPAQLVKKDAPGPISGNPQLDPKIGLDLIGKLNYAAVVGKPTFSGSSFIVYAGDCAGCSLRPLQVSRLPSKLFDEIILIFRNSKEDLQKHKSEYSGHTLVADVDGELQKTLNVRWQPRWYILRNGRLVAMQESPDDVSWQ